VADLRGRRRKGQCPLGPPEKLGDSDKKEKENGGKKKKRRGKKN